MTDAARLRPLVGDLRHIASARTVVFQDGPERGLEAILVAAGPLALTVLAGRAMDIGTVTWKGTPIGWTGPSGFAASSQLSARSDAGYGFERGLSGFLMTGGLTHIRQPANGEPLHGRLPFTPARITSLGEDWNAGVVFCEGETRQIRHRHECLVLRRRIEVRMSDGRLAIVDRVTNEGLEPVSPELLYHFNLGYPAIGPGTSVSLNGETVLPPVDMPDALVPSPAILSASGVGDAVALVDTPAGEDGFSTRFEFDTATLPCLQLWRDLRPRVGIFSVEPCTSAPGDRSAPLAAGETRRYSVAVTFENAIVGL